MSQPSAPVTGIAIAPLIGNHETDEARWLGALFSRLLAEHLLAAGLPVLDYNTVARTISAARYTLPLKPENVDALRATLRLRALVHGRYVLDEAGGMIGLQLLVSSPDILPVPMEVAFPVAGFAHSIEHVALALIERLGFPVDDALRARVRAVSRPASFQAFRQLAQARTAWAAGQHELALTAATSALMLDPDFEEAATIEVAIARAADDTATARDAFRRWAAIAAKHGRPLVSAERLMMLGHWLRGRGEWAEARRAYQDARSVYEREKSEAGMAQAECSLAGLDLLTGDTHSAIRSYRRCLRIFETSPDTRRDAAITLYNLSIAHRTLGQREEALTAIEQALALANSLKDTGLQAWCLIQRGAIRDDMGDWSLAQADYTQAARLFDVVGNETGLAIVRSHQAVLLRQQGDYDRAEVLLLQALEVIEQQADPHEQAVIWLNLADLYFAMGLYDQAWSYAEQAREAFARLKSPWADQAGELLEVLERAIEETAEEDVSPALPDAPGLPASPFSPPPSPPPEDPADLPGDDPLPRP